MKTAEIANRFWSGHKYKGPYTIGKDYISVRRDEVKVLDKEVQYYSYGRLLCSRTASRLVVYNSDYWSKTTLSRVNDIIYDLDLFLQRCYCGRQLVLTVLGTVERNSYYFISFPLTIDLIKKKVSSISSRVLVAAPCGFINCLTCEYRKLFNKDNIKEKYLAEVVKRTRKIDLLWRFYAYIRELGFNFPEEVKSKLVVDRLAGSESSKIWGGRV